MPGISLHCKLTESKPKDGERFADILSGMCHYPSYGSRVIYSDRNIMIGFSGYDSYPIRVIELENCRVFLEGMIYDRPDKDLKSDLSRITKMAFNDNHSNSELTRLIEHTVGEYDGEFWLAIYDKIKRHCLILNDCPKIKMILDKDLLDFQYAGAIRAVCAKCDWDNGDALGRL